MEAWRFTDLRGFDPDAFAVPNGQVHGVRPRPRPERTMLDIDAAAVATVSEDGIEIERAPEGVTFEPLDRRRRAARHAGRRRREVHGAQRGALEARPARPRPEGRRAREAALRPHRQTRPTASLFWRLLVVAEEGSRFSLIEEYVSGLAGPRRLLERRRRALRRAGREARVRLAPELSRETWHFATHHARVERDAELDWVAGGFGSRRRARSGSRTTSPARARPRA